MKDKSVEQVIAELKSKIEVEVEKFQPRKRHLGIVLGEFLISHVFDPDFRGRTVARVAIDTHLYGQISDQTASDMGILPAQDQRNAYRVYLNAISFNSLVESLKEKNKK